MERAGQSDRPAEADAPDTETSTLIEGRWRSVEEKVAWMLAGRERPETTTQSDTPTQPEPQSDPDTVRGPTEPQDGRIPADELQRAGMPNLTDRDVSLYLARHRQDRPWLTVAGDHDSAWIRQTVVAMDQGGGHTLERHGAYGASDDHKRRVERLEDPAQADPQLRERGVDALTGKEHYCADIQSRFTDVSSMASALRGALRDPRIVAALDTQYTPTAKPPVSVSIPIEELLGPDGHMHCEGFQLAGDQTAARAARRTWAADRKEWLREHGTLDSFTADPPAVEPVATFEGGTVQFRFWRNAAHDGYEISSFYPQPPKN